MRKVIAYFRVIMSVISVRLCHPHLLVAGAAKKNTFSILVSPTGYSQAKKGSRFTCLMANELGGAIGIKKRLLGDWSKGIFFY